MSRVIAGVDNSAAAGPVLAMAGSFAACPAVTTWKSASGHASARSYAFFTGQIRS